MDGRGFCACTQETKRGKQHILMLCILKGDARQAIKQPFAARLLHRERAKRQKNTDGKIHRRCQRLQMGAAVGRKIGKRIPKNPLIFENSANNIKIKEGISKREAFCTTQKPKLEESTG